VMAIVKVMIDYFKGDPLPSAVVHS
jgi:hypothetical protein